MNEYELVYSISLQSVSEKQLDVSKRQNDLNSASDQEVIYALAVESPKIAILHLSDQEP